MNKKSIRFAMHDHVEYALLGFDPTSGRAQIPISPYQTCSGCDSAVDSAPHRATSTNYGTFADYTSSIAGAAEGDSADNDRITNDFGDFVFGARQKRLCSGACQGGSSIA
ncbi:hypothetical protein [Rhizobium laguerreae]|uniref:hypothetical protein n=1 Tax=Rhizobium laguerreae TaxID=1076926 RepID=UPI001C8FE173|nr:hypothetical protein [Rhizobium laguerreae]MBY3562584.1 hypothetical protein [Rhizobium laguerreae]